MTTDFIASIRGGSIIETRPKRLASKPCPFERRQAASARDCRPNRAESHCGRPEHRAEVRWVKDIGVLSTNWAMRSHFVVLDSLQPFRRHRAEAEWALHRLADAIARDVHPPIKSFARHFREILRFEWLVAGCAGPVRATALHGPRVLECHANASPHRAKNYARPGRHVQGAPQCSWHRARTVAGRNGQLPLLPSLDYH
jgi:hypothetical protein